METYRLQKIKHKSQHNYRKKNLFKDTITIHNTESSKIRFSPADLEPSISSVRCSGHVGVESPEFCKCPEIPPLPPNVGFRDSVMTQLSTRLALDNSK